MRRLFDRLVARDSRDAVIAGVLVAAFLAVGVATHRDYGIAWDDAVQARYGELALAYWLSLGADRSAFEFLDLRHYGALFETLSAALAPALPGRPHEARHLLTLLAAASGLVATGLVARRLGASASAAVLALAMTPQAYGHAFVNSKDVPFAAAVAWLVLAALRLAEDPARRGRVLGCGLALGVLLSIRVGGVFPAGVVALSLVPHAVRAEPAVRRRLALAACGVVAIGWIVMVAGWPAAHAAPLRTPWEALRATLDFPVAYPVLHGGVTVSSDAVPRSYLPVLLALTTPLPLLVMALGGWLLAARRAAGSAPHAVVAAWLAVPVALFAARPPNVYDGLRHFLFLTPALAACAALAVTSLVAAARGPRARLALSAGAAAILAAPLPQMVRLHPYQMTSFNALAGGTGGAAGRWETEYWLLSYKEAGEWLTAHACRREGPTRVVVAVDGYGTPCLETFVPPGRFVLAATMTPPRGGALPEDWDFYVATTRWDLDGGFPDEPVAAVIGRDGAAFTVIRGRCRAE